MEEEYEGFKFRVLFNKYGYTPHHAEHFVENGHEKLLMADPHMRRSIIIYNIDKEEIEWEYPVKGDAIPANPHIVRILPEDVPEIGASRGSVMFADRNNEWNFVQISSGNVQSKLTIPEVKWAHDILLSKNRDGFIVTDYSAQFLSKIDFKGNVIWRHGDFGHMAKLSLIEEDAEWRPLKQFRRRLPGREELHALWRIRDKRRRRHNRGKHTCGRGTLNNFWCYAPHSAFRKGIAEDGGNLTVIGFEAGGGIVALDQWQRPRWGVMKGFTDVGGPRYIPSRYGLAETTHVFPTLRGRGWGYRLVRHLLFTRESRS